MTTPIYPPEHPMLAELHRSYAHAAHLSRTVDRLRAEVDARDATIADLQTETAALRPVAGDVDANLTRGMGELASVQISLSEQAVTCSDPGEAAFRRARVAALTECIRSLHDAREVYRTHRPDLRALAGWLLEERARWETHIVATGERPSNRVAQGSDDGWVYEASQHLDSLDHVYRAVTLSMAGHGAASGGSGGG